MRIDHTNKAVFVSTPYCGTHTIYDWLNRHFVVERPSYKQFHLAVLPKGHDDYFIWTVTRNPYSRAISGWGHKLVTDKTGDGNSAPRDQAGSIGTFRTYATHMEWVSKKPPHQMHGPQTLFLSTMPHIDMALRLESLSEEIKRLPFWSDNLKPPSHIYKMPTLKPWQQYYDEATADCIHDQFRPDFEAYGYDRDSWRLP